MSPFFQSVKVMCIIFKRYFLLFTWYWATAAGLTVLTCAKIQSIWQFELQDLFFGLKHNAYKWAFGGIIEHSTLTPLASVGLNYVFTIQHWGVKPCLNMLTKVNELNKHLHNLNKKECCFKQMNILTELHSKIYRFNLAFAT